ncbi:MAG: 2Fe-2S iron-sulfur cluster binding domain-containing protein [Burkholderiaceae bacterium]|nr:2Fe-2S iron-sulfur cluster binding domain-containing protein [Burkholderiaceae bacterium]
MMRWLQLGLRAGFMRLEALFNRAFGDPLNPLYHLGATVFGLFWVVGATGLYLFAFFDTSVDGAYRSVQSLTQDQWFAGGVIRSLHRYASDALVLTMAVHALRHFAFDRLRGFRWFSWFTGVVLIWLIYVAGANGYMLPWDRLAQFVTQASFEWLDWLPGFGGALIRNFIYPASVSNRLFSLLVFIHIGVPLVALLLMWVHVQRVPKAQTLPPRPIAIGTLAMLLALALALPVASQGGAADLAQAPATLALDWVLLALYPLIYTWPLAAVWALVGGGTLLLLAMPWLPPRRGGRQHRQPMHLTLHPGAVQVDARAGETLLEAGLRAGLTLPYDCRAGGCGVCVCTVLNGRIDPGPYQAAALTDAMRARGQALMCCAVALEDAEIEVEVPSLGAEAALRRFTGRVETMDRLADDLMRIRLVLPGGERIGFAAGQYLNIVLPGGQRRAFSFANPPHDNERIELHVRRIPGGLFTTQVFTTLQPGDTLDFEGPLGRFTLRESDRPILFVAGATGFAPVKSIVEDAFHRGVTRTMQLYWGAREAKDLYLRELAEQWQREHPNFSFVPVLSHAAPDDPWPGRRGLVHEALLADHPDLAGCEVYACGSAQMVEAAVPAFIAQGLGEQFCFSDAFTPSAAAQRPAETSSR